jgi:hypothetical protein
VIAHRLATIRNATRILVFEAGRIVESGRFDELVAQNGKFAALARAQFLTGEGPPTEMMPLDDPAQLADGPAPSTKGEEPAKAAE